jgi:hypothetical protein
VASLERDNLLYFTILVHLKSVLIREVAFDGSDIIRRVAFDGSDIIRGVAFDESGLIRGRLLCIHFILPSYFYEFCSSDVWPTMPDQHI